MLKARRGKKRDGTIFIPLSWKKNHWVYFCTACTKSFVLYKLFVKAVQKHTRCFFSMKAKNRPVSFFVLSRFSYKHPLHAGLKVIFKSQFFKHMIFMFCKWCYFQNEVLSGICAELIYEFRTSLQFPFVSSKTGLH